MFRYKAQVLSVYDGDTATLLIDVGFNIHLKEKVRFYGIDTPEIRTKDLDEKRKGLIVKQFVKESLEGREVEIQTSKEGKFGRYLVEIFIDGANFNKLLVKMDYAKQYFGGKRK